MKILLVEQLKQIEGFRSVIGNSEQSIDKVIAFDTANNDDHALMWINHKNISKLAHLKNGVVIAPGIPEKIASSVTYIHVDSPRLFFTKVLHSFFIKEEEITVADSAQIAPDAIIGSRTSIGENVVIESSTIIGDNCRIGHNTVIKKGTIIGTGVIIGCNNTIGGVGFGYEKDEDGTYIQVPHIGNVVIEDKVEIGNNTCIDRAVLGSTYLANNSKIDNLVHIAHGVQIGKNSLIIANAMIAGSVIIGDNVWVAPSSSVLNKCIIGDNSTVGMAAVVLKNVEDGDVVVGMPAKSIRK